MYEEDSDAGRPASAMVDTVCAGSRIVFTGFVADGANGEYRTAGQPQSCDGVKAEPSDPPTVYKRWDPNAPDLFLYRGEKSWYISADRCSFSVFFARISTQEGADIAQTSRLADGGSPLDIECQQGFEACGWRECVDTAMTRGGVPACLEAHVPNNEYGWLRMMWNRAVRLQDAAAPPTYGDDKCLGDFNNDGAVTVLELMEVLAAYGMVTCSLRADLDGDCAVTVRDLLILLSHFGVCTAPDAERVSEYEISRLFLSGFRSELANGPFDTSVFDQSLCMESTVLGGDGPTCLPSGQVLACSSLAANFTVYRREKEDGGAPMYLFQSRDASRWIVGEAPCREDVAVAWTAVTTIGDTEELQTLPCQEGVRSAPCIWQECSEPQYFGASCTMDCPEVRREQTNVNCPPLVPTENILVAAMGTHSDTFVATHDVGMVLTECLDYQPDADGVVPTTRRDCEEQQGTWSVGMMCASDDDCGDGLCQGGMCTSCDNSVLDGGETDVDCGGGCNPHEHFGGLGSALLR